MIWRSQQWGTFAKQWWLYDAYMQCPILSGVKISKYLVGLHKPIGFNSSEIGDSVIVFNTRNIAAKDNSLYWKRFLYVDHTRFGIHRVEQTMEEIHKKDPTKIIFKEIKCNIKNDEYKLNILCHLHLFPDGIKTVPKELLSNVSGVIRQILPIHKNLSDYTNAEIEAYPNVLTLPSERSLTDYNGLFNKLD